MSKEDNIYPKGYPKQSEEFAKNQKFKEDVYTAIKDIAQETTEKEFESRGYKKSENYQGEYSSGEKFGAGTNNEEFNIKLAGKTLTILDKLISFGGKRTVSNISIDIKPKSETIEISYKTVSSAAFRGFNDPEGPFLVNRKMIMNASNMSKFKNEIKSEFKKIAAKEVGYITKTKLGIEDKIDKSTSSMVENKKTLKSLLEKFFNEEIGQILDEGKSEKDKSNSLLFDDIEDLQEGDYKELAKKEMKKWNVSSPNELKPSEKKQFFDDLDKKWSSKDELEEISTAGSAGVAATNGTPIDGTVGTVGGFKYAANPFAKKKLKESDESEEKKFEDTNYFKNKQPRAHIKKTMNEGDSFWTTVDIEPLKKNHIAGALGMMGVDVNSPEEEEMSMTRNRYGNKKKVVKEGLDVENKKEIIKETLMKRKFSSLNENEEKGINKRYIITEKLNKEEEVNNWKRLTSFEKNESITNAENVISDERYNEIISECTAPIGYNDKYVSREEGEVEDSQEFSQRNNDLENGEVHNNKKVIIIMKPNSLSNSSYKVYEEDYLNENRAYLIDFITGNFVANPNFKPKVR